MESDAGIVDLCENFLCTKLNRFTQDLELEDAMAQEYIKGLVWRGVRGGAQAINFTPSQQRWSLL